MCMMENTKLVLVMLILMSSCGTLRVASDADLGDYLGGMLGGSGMTCMEKIMPCQPFLVPGASPPSANCCTPIKELIANDTKCICDTLNNPLVRGSLNVSVDDIMRLPKACNETFDMAVCNSTTSGTSSSSASTTVTTDSADSPPDNSSDSTQENGNGSDSPPDNGSDSPPDNGSDSTPDSDSKASGANGKLIPFSPGRVYIISLAFFVPFILTVY